MTQLIELDGQFFTANPESRKLIAKIEALQAAGHGTGEVCEGLIDKLYRNHYALPGAGSTTVLIDSVIVRAIKFGYADRHAALEAIRTIIDRKSLYHAAKHWGVLVNNSAEEFAVQFYNTYNNEVRYTY